MAIRHLTKSKYNAHTYPLFKRMDILTISDLSYLSQLKLYYTFVKNDDPEYFKHSFLSNMKLFMADILETEAVVIVNNIFSPILHRICYLMFKCIYLMQIYNIFRYLP